MKRLKALAIGATLVGAMVLSGCDGNGGGGAAPPPPPPPPVPTAQDIPPVEVPPEAPVADFNVAREINVVSREAGSGTRDAFIEILGIEQDGIDRTSPEADIANGTSVVINSVTGNRYAIGYISVGSLNDSVRALSVGGVAPTVENIVGGSYPLFRSFYLAVREEALSPIAQDFVSFILSAEGQAEVSSRGFVPVALDVAPFAGSENTGTVVITGSTSVAYLMSRLGEAFEALVPGTNVEVHSTGSGAGITGAIEGTVDIGMASRELRPTELEQVSAIAMAHDGLAVIVNNDNPLPSLTTDEIQQIFIGDLSNWSAVMS